MGVPASAARFTHTFGLGGMALVLVLLLIFTGVLMMFTYDPSPERAWHSIVSLQEDVLFGRLIRGVHHWSANLLIAVAILHVLRVFLTGGFHGRRRSNWLLGLALLFCILLSGFTGYLLPWDQTAFWAITICTEMLSQVPGVGQAMQRAVVGGSEIGSATIINFYALHVAVMPMTMFVLLNWHFWLIRKAGGVVTPSDSTDDPAPAYRVEPMLPDLLQKEIAVALLLIAFVLVAAIAFGAPLGDPANPGISPNPAKAPWYFLGFQELLIHFDAVFAVMVIPVLAVGALIAIPYLPYDAEMSGDWFLTPKGRQMAAVAALAAIVFVPAWVIFDDRVIGAGGWLPGTAPVISNGLVPFAILLTVVSAWYLAVRRVFAATRNEAVQTLFVLLFVGFAVLAATGVWFRGAGMSLVWPWQA
jgi:quinol-cytochrome oxidoreductase complex cytochrome b subunit